MLCELEQHLMMCAYLAQQWNYNHLGPEQPALCVLDAPVLSIFATHLDNLFAPPTATVATLVRLRPRQERPVRPDGERRRQLLAWCSE